MDSPEVNEKTNVYENDTLLLENNAYQSIKTNQSNYSRLTSNFPEDITIDEDLMNSDSTPEREGLNFESQTRKYRRLPVIILVITLIIILIVFGNLIYTKRSESVSQESTNALGFETNEDYPYTINRIPKIKNQSPSLIQNQNYQIDNDRKLISNKKIFQWDDMYNYTLRAESPNWTWVQTDMDGLYTYEDSKTGDIWLKHASNIFNNDSTVFKDKILLNRKDIDKFEPEYPFSAYIISPDLKYMAVANRYDKVWRHSYTSRYRIFDLDDLSKSPILVSPGKWTKDSDPTINGEEVDFIALFKWAPKGHDISFVYRNDVFILSNDFRKLKKVSKDGGNEIINGIPDWVYEEEVFASNSALWWSNDGNYLAYLSFNDKKVPLYEVPLYTNLGISSHQNLLTSERSDDSLQSFENKKDPNWKFLFADYPQYLKFKYPKSGHSNPLVSLKIVSTKNTKKDIEVEQIEEDNNHVFNVEIDIDGFNKENKIDPVILKRIGSNLSKSNKIISDVVWTSEDSKLLLRVTNKEQDIIVTSLVALPNKFSTDSKDPGGYASIKAKVVRLEQGGKDFFTGSDSDGGWYQTDSHPIFPIPKNTNFNVPESSYIDKIVYNGYYHFALFSLTSKKPFRVLTKGDYDVEEIIGYNHKSGTVYYTSREIDSTASHIFSVKLDLSGKRHISNESSKLLSSLNSELLSENKDKDKKNLNGLGHFSSMTSPSAGYLILSYLGPSIPYHTLVKSGDIDQAKILVDNHEFKEKISAYALPKVQFHKLNVNDQMINIKQIVPYNFDPKNKKYRVLFRCYGGPESQLVTRKFELNFHTWLVSNRDDIVVVIADGRGTGYKGRKFSTVISGNLGEFEAKDQLGALKAYSNYDWVYSNRLALWGWSYGGYLTAKTVEADKANLLRVAISVAPVTDWRFYDSIYTERYMKLPQNNTQGYLKSAVYDVSNFNKTDYLLLHGVADDNVHYQNSLSLLNKFSMFNITRPKFHSFPDNDHSISLKHANLHLYTRIVEHLDKFL